jgi:hypothetical protein
VLPPETYHQNLAIRKIEILQNLANLGFFFFFFFPLKNSLYGFKSFNFSCRNFGNNSPVKEILPGWTPESQSLRAFCDVAKVARSSKK